jgi:hypothetical protein
LYTCLTGTSRAFPTTTTVFSRDFPSIRASMARLDLSPTQERRSAGL